MSNIFVVDWVSYQDSPESEHDLGWMGGWFKDGHRWKDYLNVYKEEVHPYLEALRQEVVSKNIRFGGDVHQHSDDGAPKFSDGSVLRLSYRAWGDLMAAIWSEAENKDYQYMDFYM